MNRSFFDSFEDKTIFVKGSREDISPWDRTKIIGILMDESGVPFNVAEKIADDVQKIVFSSNLKTVSSSLLRELVNSKLVEYGFSKILNKTRRLGLSVSDIKGVIKNPIPYSPHSPVSPVISSNYLSDAVKRQFSVYNVFPEKLVNLHYEGKLHINGINGVDRLYSIFLDASKLINFGYSGDNFFLKKPVSGLDFFENLKKIILFLSGFVNNDITVYGLEKAILFFDLEDKKGEILKDLIKGVENTLLYERPVKLLLKDKELVKVAANMYSAGFFIKSEILTGKENYIPSRNISIFEKQIEFPDFIMENITLNLPGIALNARLNNKDFFKELKNHVEYAYSIFGKKGIFIEKMLLTRGGSTLNFLKKIGFNPLNSCYEVSVCGLQEAISLVRERYKFNEKDFDFAFEVLSFLNETIEDFNSKYNLKVLLTDSDQSDVMYRFARLDLKFEPYYIGRLVKGEIAFGGVYYSPNASFITNPYLDLSASIEVENKVKNHFDFPFKTIIKVLDFENVKISLNKGAHAFLMLTQDFSVCYHCYVMKSGIYKSCPECLSEDIENYFYLYSNYAPYSRLNRALRVMMKNNVYYEEFTI